MKKTFLHWPNSRHWCCWAAWAGVVLAVFILFYGGASWISSRHNYRVRLHFDFELSTPFVPAMAVVYLSLNFMFALTPFVLKTPAQLRAFAWTFIAMIVVATPCFLLFPGDRRQVSVESGVGWQSIVTFARTVALEHNYIPSLHVAFAVAGAWIFAREGSTAIRTSLAAWAITLIASTLLLHQHYLVDVVAGAALGVAGVRQVYDRLTTFSSETTSAANIVSQSQRASR